jgi:hypothetical protein
MKNLQEQFDKEEHYLARYKIIIANPSLATQENYDKEKRYLVRSEMRSINPSIKTNN